MVQGKDPLQLLQQRLPRHAAFEDVADGPALSPPPPPPPAWRWYKHHKRSGPCAELIRSDDRRAEPACVIHKDQIRRVLLHPGPHLERVGETKLT